MPGQSLWDHAIARKNLRAAWDHVRSRSEDADTPEGIERFAANADARIEDLAAGLEHGDYAPLPLTRIAIPKDDGGERELSVPAVRDRIVERSLLRTVTPYVDRNLGPASYAYREGLGVADAIRAVAELRDEGLHWVLHADVDNCFDSIPRDQAVRALNAMLPDGSVRSLIEALTSRPVATRQGLVESSGVPQGTALSPMLANIVLTHLDDALLDRGLGLVRYADDFVVVCRSRDLAWEAARIASTALEEIGMKLGVDKTEIMNFDDGFCFLGEDFGPRYPPVTGTHRVDEPTRRVLNVARQGSRIFTKNGRVVIESKKDEELLSVPKNLVARIACFGAVSLAAGTRSWTLEDGVDVVFLSQRGTYLGQHLSAADGTRVARVRAQLDAVSEPAAVMRVAGVIVDAKIRHQITLIQRFARERDAGVVKEALNVARRMRAMIPAVLTAEELLGLEGAAAAAYFQALGHMVPAELAFERRSRRPPMDVFNSALGYGYALLLSECVSALVIAGLDPNIGFLHKASGRRPGLALDLMEEFRPLVVDQVVLSAARRSLLTPGHGVPAGGAERGIHLSKAGKAVLVDGYEKRMLQVTGGAIPGFRGTWRRHVYRQAKLLMKAIMEPERTWEGMSWR